MKKSKLHDRSAPAALPRTKRYSQPDSSFQTLNIQQAADFLKCCPETVRKLAREGTLAGSKVGRRWVFLVDDLVRLIRRGNNARRLPMPGKDLPQWHYTNGDKPIGSVSQDQTERELDALLAQPITRKRKRSLTS